MKNVVESLGSVLGKLKYSIFGKTKKGEKLKL